MVFNIYDQMFGNGGIELLLKFEDLNSESVGMVVEVLFIERVRMLCIRLFKKEEGTWWAVVIKESWLYLVIFDKGVIHSVRKEGCDRGYEIGCGY